MIRFLLGGVLVLMLSGCLTRSLVAKPRCGEPIAGLAPVLRPGAMVIFGEFHGTKEVPKFFGQVVCQAALERQPVRVALEMPIGEQRLVEALLLGAPEASRQLLASPFWTDPFQDGRKSLAMFELLQSIRQLRLEGANVEVFPFDIPPDQRTTGEARDEFMAQQLTDLRRQNPLATIVVLTGTGHGRRKAGAPWNRNYRWMGAHLAGAGLSFVSLSPKHAGGTAWFCPDMQADHCGAGRVADAGGVSPVISMHQVNDGEFDGEYSVGLLSASPPAAFPEKAAGLEEKLAALDTPEIRRSEALRRDARADYDAGKFASCAEKLAKLPPNATDLYDLACCYARAGKKEAALSALNASVETGMKDAKQLASDDDFKALRDDARFQTMVEKLDRGTNAPHSSVR
jgi:hypothetical protein